jgi:endonuclease/exonuclease/phosphatase family metal-dependent hydrolase
MDWRSWLIPGSSEYLIHMKPGFAGQVFVFLFVFLFILPFLRPVHGLMGVHAQGELRVEFCFVWYNVENLFYPENDAAVGDEEFTPQGLYHWTWTRYRDKLTALAKVIIAAGRGKAPELVGLCEVENARVLEDLCSHPILRPYSYSYFHRESKDHRGMDVACLIRGEGIKAIHWECIALAPPVQETRELMHISLHLNGDTLDLFLVHLLSKYGGAGATADLRRTQTSQLAQLMDSVYAMRQQGWILAAGDFNEAFQGYGMEPLRSARFGGDSLSLLHPEKGYLSYKYRGRWTPIDQVLQLGSAPASITVSTLRLSPLMTEDLEYGGLKPRRCYEGLRYRGGISDHLPLLIDISPSYLSVPVEQ